MTVTTLWATQYRSLVNIRLDLHPVTVIQGENATGKTNLYRVLLLLSRGAAGGLAQALLDEGGMPSALSATDVRTWGRRTASPIRMRFGAHIDDICYEFALGLPSVEFESTPFALDAEIKEESAWVGSKRTRHSLLLDRAGSTATARDIDGTTTTFGTIIDRFEPALSQLGEPAGVLLRATVEDAFPGATLSITSERGTFGVGLLAPGLRRPMKGHELSDGTLRYLTLVAALLTPRPPDLLVLNEPETSLHGSLIAPLARLINEASRRCQIIVTTHSLPLADAVARSSGYPAITLTRREGWTTVASP